VHACPRRCHNGRDAMLQWSLSGRVALVLDLPLMSDDDSIKSLMISQSVTDDGPSISSTTEIMIVHCPTDCRNSQQ
jgi:hypothetical protein